MTARMPFRERLAQGTPILFDGATGTLLYRHGQAIDSCFDESNLTDPEVVRALHIAYLEAGAEVIETNTFSANPFKLAEYNLADSVEAINKAGVARVREAIAQVAPDHEVYIAGSIGPLGVRLAPYGRVSPERAREAFGAQAAALIGAGVDLLVFETFSDLTEIITAIEAARRIDPNIPLLAQMTFTRDDRTELGDTPAKVATRLAQAGADVVGVNCSNGPVQVLRLAGAMRRAQPDTRLSAMPNAGWPENVGGRVIYSATPEYFASFAISAQAQGITAIGGCCGTTPDHIGRMRSALDRPGGISPLLGSGLSLAGREAQPGGEEPEAEEEAGNALAGKISRGEFVIAVEISPPRSASAELERHAAWTLKEAGADVIDVLDSPMARMRMSPWALCHLLQTEVGIETVLHFPTRGRNLLRIQGDLLAAHALGLRNLFVVMGDPTRIGDFPDAADNYDLVPTGLIRLIKHDLNQGKDSGGNLIGEPTRFLVSAALSLAPPDLDKEIDLLRKKIENGADYFLTQPLYDIDLFHRFMERYEVLHGPLQRPVLVGLLPLYSYRNAAFLHNEVPGITIPEHLIKRMEAAGDNAKYEGLAIAQELAGRVAKLAQGIYLIPQFNRYDFAAEIIETIRQPVS